MLWRTKPSILCILLPFAATLAKVPGAYSGGGGGGGQQARAPPKFFVIIFFTRFFFLIFEH